MYVLAGFPRIQIRVIYSRLYFVFSTNTTEYILHQIISNIYPLDLYFHGTNTKTYNLFSILSKITATNTKNYNLFSITLFFIKIKFYTYFRHRYSSVYASKMDRKEIDRLPFSGKNCLG